MGRLVHALDPAPLVGAARWRRPTPAGGAFLCIYRPGRVGEVERMVAEARSAGMRIALWGLDGRASSLEAWTIGDGRHGRMDLLNLLYASVEAETTGSLVFADDDVAFARGGVAGLVRAAERCGFDLAQPAHARSSNHHHGITHKRLLTLARRVSFVEVGPMVVIGPRWRDRLLPFPADFGMGWGLELLWIDLERAGCRLGVVDAVTIDHLGPTGVDYVVDLERERIATMLAERGVGHLHELHAIRGTWRAWQRRLPWGDEPT